jgi:prepilin-type N-terminal cleavage/methylation domain-containing protein
MQKAFTLVELIVVMTILSILWTMALVSLIDYQETWSVEKRKTTTVNYDEYNKYIEKCESLWLSECKDRAYKKYKR